MSITYQTKYCIRLFFGKSCKNLYDEFMVLLLLKTTSMSYDILSVPPIFLSYLLTFRFI